MQAKNFVSAVAALVIAAPAMAQSFNIDFSVTSTTSPGPAPANTYGAAASQVGFWNNITNALATNVALSNLAGAATGATITLDGGSMLNLNVAPNGTITSGQDELFMDDAWDPGAGALAGTITFNNLQNGIYRVYTYAGAGDSATFTTSVTVPGAVQGSQNVSGQWSNPFSYQQGVTHAVHDITVSNGSLAVQIGVVSGFASVNGIQLVLVPGPGALALLGFAGLVGTRRRRE